MKLKDLFPGHAFRPSTVVGAPVSFTCQGVGFNVGVNHTVEAQSYFLMPTQVLVEPIALMEHYDNGIGFYGREGWDDRQTLDSVAPGTVCMLPGGVVPLILKTRHKFPSRLQGQPDAWICAALHRPDAKQGDIEVDDLGMAADYNGLKFFMPERVI